MFSLFFNESYLVLFFVLDLMIKWHQFLYSLSKRFAVENLIIKCLRYEVNRSESSIIVNINLLNTEFNLILHQILVKQKRTKSSKNNSFYYRK
jgi:hypothetical protein